MRKSIMKGFARRNRERRDIGRCGRRTRTRRHMFRRHHWHAARKARELELKYLRDRGVYEKVDETESLPWTRNGLTQTRRSRESTCRSDHECLRESSKAMIGQTCMQETPPLEALKAITSIAANNKETFSIMHIDV